MSSHKEAAEFTLSFSGVDFTLEPSDCSPNNHFTKVLNDQVIIDFRNFTGILRVAKGDAVKHAATCMPTEETEQSIIVEADASKTGASVSDAVPEEEGNKKRKVCCHELVIRPIILCAHL
jgi:hypothetical protein